MCSIKCVKAETMFQVVKEVLDKDKNARITVTGTSMYPFLREGKDSVELSPASYDKVGKGSIVLIRRKSGEYVLHRVLRKKKNCFYMVGDAQQWIEGPLKPEQLLAAVTAVWRMDKRIGCESIRWRLLSLLWLFVLPLRRLIINLYRWIRPKIKRKKKQTQGGRAV